MSALLCEAIAGRQVVRFAYGGGLRTVEPHAHGWSQVGDELLRGYQTFGFSESGGGGWRTFRIDGVEGLRVASESFAPRSDVESDQPGIARVHCSVSA